MNSGCERAAARTGRAFIGTFGLEPQIVAAAPGRVNLIGEHTDYNDGFVLPMAINRWVCVACAPRSDDVVRVHATAFNETREITLAGLQARPRAWDAYVAGVIWALATASLPLRGAELLIAGDLPAGAGLASSAALELATARALCAASDIPWDPREMARLACRAENEFVGVSCGIMDQCASAVSAEGYALLLDCRSLETRHVAIPVEACIVVMDTGIRRTLAASAYNNRRAACERAAAAARTVNPGVSSLRDVGDPLLTQARDRMDDEAYQRARHVVAEMGRPVAMAAALEAGDAAGAGRLMNESHASLRDLYEVSSPELDAIVAAARTHRSCYGARLTGAGFGGCAIALVETTTVEEFMPVVAAEYRRITGRDASLFVSHPAAGARLVVSNSAGT